MELLAHGKMTRDLADVVTAPVRAMTLAEIPSSAADDAALNFSLMECLLYLLFRLTIVAPRLIDAEVQQKLVTLAAISGRFHSDLQRTIAVLNNGSTFSERARSETAAEGLRVTKNILAISQELRKEAVNRVMLTITLSWIAQPNAPNRATPMAEPVQTKQAPFSPRVQERNMNESRPPPHRAREAPQHRDRTRQILTPSTAPTPLDQRRVVVESEQHYPSSVPQRTVTVTPAYPQATPSISARRVVLLEEQPLNEGVPFHSQMRRSGNRQGHHNHAEPIGSNFGGQVRLLQVDSDWTSQGREVKKWRGTGNQHPFSKRN